MFVDTHSHLYLENFNQDIAEVVERAVENRILKIYLPNIDNDSIEDMIKLEKSFPDIFRSMNGLHPGSVKDNFMEEIDKLSSFFDLHKFVAIGEIGIDLYWDTTYKIQQIEALELQLDMAKELNLPVILHTRESMDLTIDIIKNRTKDNLSGIFHCFTGNISQAEQIIELGFLLGIGGVITYKKSDLPDIIQNIDMKHIVLETDSPFLPPTPYRGKRNESSYITLIAQKIAEIKGMSIQNIGNITTDNALRLFNE